MDTATAGDKHLTRLGWGRSQESINMNKVKTLTAGGLGILGLAVVSAPAYAAPDAADLEEVVVTARKVEERLIDVPLSLAAYTAEDLAASGATNIRDIALSTPGLFVSSSQGRSGDRISIRGINTVVPTQGYVGVYVDGVFVGSSSAQSVELSNLERVEILKGPQSALFGRSTLSGAINYITRKPDDEFGGKVDVTFGQYSRAEISGSMWGPLSDTVSFIVGARSFEVDGMYRNNYDGRENIGGQRTTNATAGLRWEPSDSLSFYLRTVYTKDSDDQVAVAAQSPLGNNCLADPRSIRPTLSLYYCGQLNLSPSQIFLAASNATIPAPFNGRYTASDGEAGLDRTATRTSLTAEWDIGFATLTSISAYTDEKQRDGFDLTYRAALTYAAAVNLPAITFDRQFTFEDKSQEIRLLGNTEGPFGWLAGVYYFDNSRSEVATYRLPAAAANAGTLSATNSAAYGRLEYDLTERLSVSAEGRWQKDKVQYQNPVNGLSASAETSSFLPRATIDYKLSDDMMVYALYARGNKPITINTAPELPSQLRYTKEEEAQSVEVGFKGRMFDGRVTLLAAFFDVDWTNQESSGICLPGECGGVATITRYTANFGKTAIKGYEFDLSGDLIRDWLNLRVAYSNSDTQVKSGRTNSAGEALEGILAYGTTKVTPICATGGAASPYCGTGQSLQGATFNELNTNIPAQPETQLSASLTLGHTLGATGLRWAARADFVRLGKQYEGFYNLAWVGPRENVNLRLTLSADTWDISLWGRNVTDDKTPTTILRSVAFKDDDGTGPYTANSRAFAGFFPDRSNYGVTVSKRF
jgi:iron complex outermembrane receptor protein